MILILIIGLLFALGGIIFLAWLFVLFPPSTPKSKNFKKQLLPSPARTPRVRLPKNLKKHLNNIEYASQVLLELRSITQLAKLPVVIATLRRISPYVFEELVLTCCFEQGWQIQRNFRYTGDGGIDGRVLILGKLYVIQVKRYADYISPEHIKDFLSCIESERASGGFFVHTGITGQLSKQFIRDSDEIILVSGQKLVNFVLGKQLKIIGITIPVKSVKSYQ
ncbi:restriction endonuclease [Nostoc sp.]